MVRLLEAVRRQRLIVVCVLALTVLKAYVAQSLVGDIYEARAAIVVSRDSDGTSRPAPEIHILRSRQLLGDVIDEVGPLAFNSTLAETDRFLDRLQASARRAFARVFEEGLIALDLRKRLSERDRALARLQGALVVESHDNTDVIVLRLRLPDAGLAVKVQETLLEHYQRRRVLIGQNLRSRASTEPDTERLRESLARAEDELTRTRQAASLVNRVTDRTDRSSALLAELDERRRRIEQNYVSALRRENAASRHQLNVRPIAIIGAPAASMEPVSPPKLLLMVLAVPAGLLLGVTTAAVREWACDRVRDASSLELATGLVCFGSFTDRRG